LLQMYNTFWLGWIQVDNGRHHFAGSPTLLDSDLDPIPSKLLFCLLNHTGDEQCLKRAGIEKSRAQKAGEITIL
jgi:hypothetical protein